MVTLKDAVEAVVSDLRIMLQTCIVPVGPVSLVETLDTMNWFARRVPVGAFAIKALDQTIKDCHAGLIEIAHYADDAGNTEVRDRVYRAANSLCPYFNA